MWSAPGQRITSAPTFMPDAAPEVRALYRRHVRGNSLFRNLGNGRFEDRTLEAHAEMGRWAWSSDALDFDSDGWDDLYVVNGMLTRKTPAARASDLEAFFWRQVVARSPLTRVPGTPYDDAWRAINQLLDSRLDRQPPAQRVPPQRRTRRLRRDLRDASASTSIRTADRSRCSTSTARAIRISS